MCSPELLNAAMGARRLTNKQVAAKAHLATATVSAIQSGEPKIRLPSLKAIADAVGLEMGSHSLRRRRFQSQRGVEHKNAAELNPHDERGER